MKEQRKGRYIGKAVPPDTAADHEGIINFTASNIKAVSYTHLDVYKRQMIFSL